MTVLSLERSRKSTITIVKNVSSSRLSSKVNVNCNLPSTTAKFGWILWSERPVHEKLLGSGVSNCFFFNTVLFSRCVIVFDKAAITGVIDLRRVRMELSTNLFSLLNSVDISKLTGSSWVALKYPSLVRSQLDTRPPLQVHLDCYANTRYSVSHVPVMI